MPVACPYKCANETYSVNGIYYSSPNAYFITICLKDFLTLFGEIRNGIMGFSDIGSIAAVYMQNIPELRSNILLDEFIIMPNHLHCILIIIENKEADIKKQKVAKFGQPVESSIFVIINQYKGAVKKWGNKNELENFEWQGKFYDHIIRDEKSYQTIKNYIINNPANRQHDKFHP
jgi:REP element-mobilizing transposase RayT